MLFKLTLPIINKKIEGGRIICWYKEVGDWVDYGDELCEIQIEKKKKLNRNKSPIDILFGSSNQGDRFSKFIIAGEKLKICVSDIGFLRLINIPEKKEVNIGDLLAILTTEKDELIPDNINSVNLDQLTNFRVVINLEDRGY
ncbi:hypothetical protein [Geminocystis sp. GBBB08]|uniref:hypothetical protein n=1 Tax=Geminocystis sp. GBBB08 TaxID=2604140 RepID=UPI0027E35CD4|nr:hypothetical protein [Geminocystis sp. GBBB08]MBL1209292.1 hypothetical protein [Geminocystis sp. GBBB08]